jgi:hypothetical protein
MYFYQIKCCFYTQNGCMNKQILQRLIPSQIPDRFSKLINWNILVNIFIDLLINWLLFKFSYIHDRLATGIWFSPHIIYFSSQKRLKHGRQNITLHWINGIIRNKKCIFTKLNVCTRMYSWFCLLCNYKYLWRYWVSHILIYTVLYNFIAIYTS